LSDSRRTIESMDNRKTLKIDSERLISELIKLSKVTYTPGRGVTRFSYTEKDGQIRDYLAEVADDYGFSYKTDKLGNVMIIPDGSRASLIMGSHIDTVRNGGWLDGIYGVLSGLEVLRTFAENDFAHDAALLIYAEEEGSVFGSTMTGSKFLAGVYGDDDLDLLKDDSGRTLRSHLEECGYIGPQTTSVHDVRLDFEKIRMMLELHIEQGPVLDKSGLNIGIVDTVFGMHVMQITYRGMGNHAGASPMKGRRDPLVAMARAVLAIRETAEADPQGNLVATVGKAEILPGCSNVIPDSVTFTVDIRSSSNETIDTAAELIRKRAAEIGEKYDVICSIDDIAASKAIPLSRRVIEDLDEMCREQQIRYRHINSGAVHDTAMMAAHTEAGMIFVPSVRGRSHVPGEDTKTEDLRRGAQLLCDFVTWKSL